MKNWKTTVAGIAIVAVYVLSYVFPEHKDFINGFIPVLVAAGFIVSKDTDK